MNSTTDDSSKGVQRHQPSRSIPLPRCHITRTPSELQLIDDRAVAEWRDICMFYRVTSRIPKIQYYDGGAPISFQRFEQSASSHPPSRTNQVIGALDAVRVTPDESFTEDSPLQHSEWSINGSPFDLQEPRQHAVIKEDTSDGAVFEMEW